MIQMDEVKTIVLGTAQDGGYPHPGCSCPNCKRSRRNTSLKRLPASLGIIDPSEKESFIIDATPELPKQLALLNHKTQEYGLPPNNLSGILLTHAHMGHYTGLMYLGKEALDTDNLPVYCTSAMKKFIENNLPWSDLVENDNIMIHVNDKDKTQLTGRISIQGIPVPHRNEHADTVGFLIKGKNKNIFYLPDLDHWDNFITKFSQVIENVDYVFIDGTFYDETELGEHRGRDMSEVPHPPIKKTIKIFKNNNIKKENNRTKIYFTHFNHTNRVLSLDHELIDTIKAAQYGVLSEEMIFKI
jgi:pyrroloquinoline quinone biosynthesis protein B